MSIYIVGAQCTGKTTLVNGLHSALQAEGFNLHRITEVARTVLHAHKYTRDDIAGNPHSALKLQHLILSAQFEAENEDACVPVLCDRSGIDPIAYAVKYGPRNGRESLEQSEQWQTLKYRMFDSLVVLCPPHQGWLTDDGTRLIASSWQEWHDMHLTFCQILQENQIPFSMLPDDLELLEDRVEFVLQLWRSFLPRSVSVPRTVLRGLSARPLPSTTSPVPALEHRTESNCAASNFK
ncbi:AAA domain-containing protein [Aspergillus bertholletiae]|uniref:AAA domain-containing protein n=1 Tax=Aspergillus bertholletiae TaxID=1226010 RepID=A0A5N7BNA7_9EURO|nr:AAA domain-containing protein [Aspergillus bertholletiae]